MSKTVLMRAGLVVVGLGAAAFAKHFDIGDFAFSDWMLMFGGAIAGSQVARRVGDIG